MTSNSARRVAVARSVPLPRGHRPVSRLDVPVDLDDGRMRSLIRRQLRTGLVVCCSTCGVMVVLPLLFAAAPAVGRWTVFGFPLPWLVLGVLVYPFLTGAAIVYVRRAERNDRAFSESVEGDRLNRSETP